MDSRPSGNIDNPSTLGRFKRYTRPVQPVQRAQPQILSDVANEFVPISQTVPVKQVSPVSQSYNQQSMATPPVTQLRPVSQPQIQPPISQPNPPSPTTLTNIPFDEQYTQATQPQFPNENQNYIQPAHSQNINNSIPQQPAASTPNFIPTYENNYGGEYEDIKASRLSLAKQRIKNVKLKTFILSGSAALAFVLIGAFVIFMNWNNNSHIAQAQANNSNSQKGTSQNNYASSSPVTGNQIAAYTVPPTSPRYLIIPKIHAKTIISPVSLNSANLLDAPGNINTVGWWQASVQPGQSGSVVLDGFVNNGSQAGALSQLNQLTPGDTFSVEVGNGSSFNYKVVKIVQFGTSGLTMNDAISPVTKGVNGLNIITCTGQSLTCPATNYSDFVVFSEQIN